VRTKIDRIKPRASPGKFPRQLPVNAFHVFQDEQSASDAGLIGDHD
jgi:hypothetical protein